MRKSLGAQVAGRKRRRRMQIALGMVCLGLLSLQLLAENLDFRHPQEDCGLEFWGADEGLPQIRLREIVQTRDGYLWLGTAGGLVRFDGVNFTTFDIHSGSLKDNEINSMVEDDEGALWIATNGGGLTRLKNGGFTTFTTADGLLDDSIREIDKDFQGNIWMATPRGVCRYSKGVFTSFTTRDGLSQNFVSTVCARSPMGIFAGSGSRLHRLVEGRFEVVEQVCDDADVRLDCLTSSADGSLWLTYEDSIIKHWSGDVVTVYTQADPYGGRSGLTFEYPPGTLWIGARDCLLRLTNGTFDKISPPKDLPKPGMVLSMCADREGNLWLGTETEGLARIRPITVRTITVEDGLPSSSTRCVFQDSRGDVWIGTYTGFARLSRGTVTAFSEMEGRPIPSVTSIGEDGGGRIWIAAGGQLFILENEQLTPVPGWKKVFDIKVIHRDAQGRMWVGSDGNGLYQFESGTFQSFRLAEGLVNNQVRAILNDRQGALWVGTCGGLSRYQNGTFTNFTVADGLANDHILALLEDPVCGLWVATRSGLSWFRNGRFVNFREKDGLPDSFIYNILDDGQGQLWMGNGKGICRVARADLEAVADGKKEQLEAITLGHRDGLHRATLITGTQPTACLSKSGELLFCSLKGLVMAKPAPPSTNLLVPPVYLERLLVNNQPRPIAEPLKIPSGSHDVEVHYTALSYVAPEKVRFKYMLEGMDSEWIEAGPRRFVHYAHLPPGSYRFRVIACNNDGLWNEEGASLKVTILPPWWATWWFRAVATASLLGGVFAGYRWRVRAITRRAAALEQQNDRVNRLVMLQTAELRESKERFRILFKENPDACFLFDSDGRFLDGNKAVEQQTGYRIEELIGHGVFESGIFPPVSHAIAAERIEQLGRGAILEPIEYSLQRKDGTELSVEITTMPVRLQGRTVFLSSARDLTARRQAERKLAKSEERYRRLFEAETDAILVFDEETHQFVDVNEAAQLLYGYTRDELLGLTKPGIAAEPDSPDEPGPRILQDPQGPVPVRWHRKKDGTIFPVEISRSTFTLNGRVVVCEIVRDITDRRRMQEALERRVVALTQPLDQPEGITFDDLFDRQQIQRIQDEFSAATGVASIITHPDGTPITTPSNFSDLCLGIIRQTDTGCSNCYKSGADLGRHNPDWPIIQQCLGCGLWTAGSRITIGGRHIANWLVGQIRSETPAEDQIRAYAREIGADENASVVAFHRVPVMALDHFEAIAQALFTLANQLSNSAYQNIQQARFITKQKQSEQDLQESEEKYRKLFESESDAIMIFDGETRRFIDVNQATVELYGYSRQEFLQLTQADITAEPQASDVSIRKTLEGLLSSVAYRLHRKKDGSVFPVEIKVCCFAWKGRLVVCGVIRDITQRVAHEEELEKNRRELRQLASELSLAEQRERERIARELHDGVCQLLGSSLLRLSTLTELSLPATAVESLNTIRGILQDTMRQTRSLTFELSCPMLNELGLAAALEELCASMTHEQSIRFEFKGDTEPLALAMDRKIVLYRSARELLINVTKHSEAKRACVKLDRVDEHVRICVEDDGKGFDASMAGRGFSPTGGFGLFNIREYLQHTGGNLKINSIPGAGTEVVLSMPVEESAGWTDPNPLDRT